MKPDQNVLSKIASRVATSRRIDYGTYHYFVWPYKGISPIEPEELDALVSLLESRLPRHYDLVFTFQTDGEILAVPLALRAGKKLVVCRDVPYEMPDPMIITQHTRYWTRDLYCERLYAHQQVVIVEALISTGSTVIEAVRQIRKCGAEVAGVIAVVSKIDYDGEEKIKQETGLECSVLLRVSEAAGDALLKTEWLL